MEYASIDVCNACLHLFHLVRVFTTLFHFISQAFYSAPSWCSREWVGLISMFSSNIWNDCFLCNWLSSYPTSLLEFTNFSRKYLVSRYLEKSMYIININIILLMEMNLECVLYHSHVAEWKIWNCIIWWEFLKNFMGDWFQKSCLGWWDGTAGKCVCQ